MLRFHVTRLVRRYATFTHAHNELRRSVDTFRINHTSEQQVYIKKLGNDVASRYFAVLEEKTADPSVDSLSLDDFTDVMNALVVSNRVHDLALVEQMFHDMPAFGFRPLLVHHRLLLTSMAKRPTVHPRTALEFISGIRLPGFRPERFWEILLAEYASRYDLPALLVLVDIADAEPGFLKLAYNALLEALVVGEKKATRQDLDFILAEMQTKDIQPSKSTAQVVVQACQKLSIEPPESLATLASSPNPSLTWDAWIHQLQRTTDRDNIDNTLRKGKLGYGFVPDAAVLAALTEKAHTAVALKAAEQKLGVKAGASHWANVVRNALDRGGPRAAVQALQDAEAAGIEPTTDMVEPVVRGLLTFSLSPPSWKAICLAVDLYNSLDHVQYRGSSEADLALSHLLIDALSASTHPDAEEHKQHILEGMEDRGLSLSAEHATSMAMHAIHTTRSHRAALDAFRAARDFNPMRYVGHVQILRHICHLAFLDAPFVPPPVFFEFARDIVWRNYPLRTHVYFIVFARYLDIAKMAATDLELRKQLHRAVREVHNRLLLDTTVHIDAQLSSCIMTTYLFTNDFEQVVHMFEEALSSGTWTPAAVSTVFDACGRGLLHRKAQEIHIALLESGYKLNPRNRVALVECYARCGEFDVALDALCNGEVDGSDDAVNATSVLLKLVADNPLERKVFERLQSSLPKTYAALCVADSRIAHRARARGFIKTEEKVRLGKWSKKSGEKEM